MNWFLRYLTSNDPKRTITKTGLQFRKALYPLVRRLLGPLTDVEGILVKNRQHQPHSDSRVSLQPLQLVSAFGFTGSYAQGSH